MFTTWGAPLPRGGGAPTKVGGRAKNKSIFSGSGVVGQDFQLRPSACPPDSVISQDLLGITMSRPRIRPPPSGFPRNYHESSERDSFLRLNREIGLLPKDFFLMLNREMGLLPKGILSEAKP